MQEFKNRIVEFARTQYNMGQTRFEEKCGIHPGTISAIKSNGPTAAIVTKIAFTCPELNLNWLFRGEGDMLNNSACQNDYVQKVFITNFADMKDLIVSAIKESRV